MISHIKKKKLLVISVGGYIVFAVLFGAWSQIKITKWERDRQSKIDESPTVHVTSEGAKYHNSRHYADRSREISLYEAKEQGYEPCKICFRHYLDTNGELIPSRIELKDEALEILPLPFWPIRHWTAFLILLGLMGLVIISVPTWKLNQSL